MFMGHRVRSHIQGHKLQTRSRTAVWVRGQSGSEVSLGQRSVVWSEVTVRLGELRSRGPGEEFLGQVRVLDQVKSHNHDARPRSQLGT
jgi:hypothetical protein